MVSYSKIRAKSTRHNSTFRSVQTSDQKVDGLTFSLPLQRRLYMVSDDILTTN